MGLKIVDHRLLTALCERAQAAPRRRANHNLHPALEDPVQRLCNALEPDTYVRPHRHAQPPKWELVVVLAGAADLVTFDARGMVQERIAVAAGGPVYAAEIGAGVWHTLVARTPGTVLFEVKPGPYSPVSDKDFAPWAPAEGAAQAAGFRDWLMAAGPGARASEGG